MKTKLLFILCASSFATFSQQELIQNGSFEQGEVSWDFTLSADAFGDVGICGASDGDSYLWFGDFDELTGLDLIDYDEVAQDVQLPANLNNAVFSFYWSGGSDEQDDIDDWDFLYFGIFDANGDEIYYDSISNADMDVTITAADCDPMWYAEGFTIPAQYAGQTITVSFVAYTDDTNPTLFRVDEVSILATTGVGITENVISNLVVGPNPASDAITVKNLSTSEMDVVILNSEGKEMSKTLLSQGENEINISALSSGIYFIKEMNGLVTKLIKQ
jgi:hypothetical protein